MKIVLIGANGQLGSDLAEALSDMDLVPLNHQDIEITDPLSTRGVLESIRPQVIINTAAFHNVPACETDPEKALRGNILGPRFLAQAAAALEAELIHFSTDYVFDGRSRRPYIESDPTGPLNFYGVTKAAGEQAALAAWERCRILRVSGIYGRTPCRAKGHNFVSQMRELASKREFLEVVNDEVLTPTSTRDIAAQTRVLLDSTLYGILHVANQGQCSWYEFAKAIFRILGQQVTIHPVPASRFPAVVKRPAYSVLENRRLIDAGLNRMPHWEDALKNHLTGG